MADNVQVDQTTGVSATTTFGADDIGGIKFPRSKIIIGADNTNDGDVSATNPMPTLLRSEQVDDAAFTPATSRVIMVGAQLDNTSPDSVDEGDGGALRMSANRSLFVNIRDNAGNERGLNVDASGNITTNIASAQTLATVTNVATIGTSVTPGTSAAHLGKAEDAAHSSGDTGVMALTVRANTAAATSGADGDYQPLITDTNGRLHVLDANSASALTALQLIDDPVFADNAAYTPGTSKTMVMGGVYQSSPGTLANNDAGAILLDASGRIVVSPGAAAATIGTTDLIRVGIFDASNNQITSFGGSGGTAMVDDAAFTVGTTNVTPVAGTYRSTRDTLDDNDAGAIALTQRRAVLTCIETPAGDSAMDDTNDAVKTVVSTALPAGTNAIGKLAANSGVDIGDVDVTSLPAVAGPVAQDSAVSGNPVLIGYRASAAVPSQMSGDGDAVYPWATRSGALCVMGGILDDTTFIPGTTNVLPVGLQADETSTDSVDEGDVGCPRMTLDRKAIVTVQPHTAGGATAFYNLDVDETEDDIKTSAGTLYSLALINTTNALLYVKLYNATAASTAVGTTTPLLTIPVPGNNDTDGAGICYPIPSCGIKFDTALCIAATTAAANNDTGAPATGAIIASGSYF